MICQALCCGERVERGDDARLFAKVPHVALLSALRQEGQAKLFEGWEKKDEDRVALEQKLRVAHCLKQLDEAYPPGLVEYVKRAKKLLTASRVGANPLDGWVACVPREVEVLDDLGSESMASLEAAGLAEMGHAAFVVVAGGLGERLGYSGIKLALPCETTTKRCYLELYCGYLAAWGSSSSRMLPLAIMTSDDTHEATLQLLESSGYFGLKKQQVTLLKQEKVPSLVDETANFEMDKATGLPTTKPHGHGDVHSLLHTSGLARKWRRAGVRQLVFLQDTNALALQIIPGTIGVSLKRTLDVNTVTVPRKAKQEQGAVADLVHEDGRRMVVNVEYNQLGPMLLSQSTQGDVADETGFSPFPGNTNCFVVDLTSYVKTLQRTRGEMPEFVNPKYKDSSRTEFKKPTRLECMMQDYPRLLLPDARVGLTRVPAWMCYSPVKNPGRENTGVLPACAASGEADMYAAHANWLRGLGCQVEQGDLVTTAGGVVVRLAPQIVIEPSFATCFEELRAKFPDPQSVRIAKRSTFVLRGRDCTIRSLDLDGALVIDAGQGTIEVARLTERNAGREVRLLVQGSEEEPEETRMRGYELTDATGETRLILAEPGATLTIDE